MGDPATTIDGWLQGINDNFQAAADPRQSPVDLSQFVTTGPTYHCLFRDSTTVWDTSLYSFEGGLIPDSEAGLPWGQGTVSRKRTWVWPKFTGFTTWAKQARENTLHSVEAEFWADGVICGLAELTYSNGVSMKARFSGGLPQGLAVALFKDQVIWTGRMNREGQVESCTEEGSCTCREAERGPGLWGEEDRQEQEDNTKDGQCCAMDWEAGGLLVGRTHYLGRDNVGHLTGYFTYIYPDRHTALVGTFAQGEMLSARQAVLQSCSIQSGLLHVVCSEPSGPCFNYAPPNKASYGASNPHLQDPYEARLVSVRRSKMAGGGEGVFARRDLPAGTLAAFFNGHKVPLGEREEGQLNCEEEELYDRLAYTIHMPQEEDFYLDIPPAQADLKTYSASSGHKINHSFLPNCVFGTVYHPRWGRVRSVCTQGEVRKGEELLVDYGYDLLRCPGWFRDLWKKELGHTCGNYWDWKRE